MSITEIISDFGRDLVATRFDAGSYVNGTYVPGSTNSIDIVMSVQPLNGKELMILPEGERTKNYVRGYTDTQLYTAQQSDSKKADRVSVDDVVYEVQKVEKWEGNEMELQPYWKVMMAEVNP